MPVLHTVVKRKLLTNINNKNPGQINRQTATLYCLTTLYWLATSTKYFVAKEDGLIGDKDALIIRTNSKDTIKDAQRVTYIQTPLTYMHTFGHRSIIYTYNSI